MEQLFLPILDDDEKIEKTYKPQKCKMFFSALFGTAIMLLIFCFGMCGAFFFPDTDGFALDAIYALLPVGIFAVGISLVAIFTNACYKKTVYAITNKRIIIRTGVIGIDFKSLDMSMIGAIDVYVGLSDKLLRKNTGTVRFGSTSSPMTNESANRYAFKHLVNPYQNCKEIKAKIDAYKQSQLNK